jgi:hypothetical protein
VRAWTASLVVGCEQLTVAFLLLVLLQVLTYLLHPPPILPPRLLPPRMQTLVRLLPHPRNARSSLERIAATREIAPRTFPCHTRLLLEPFCLLHHVAFTSMQNEVFNWNAEFN